MWTGNLKKGTTIKKLLGYDPAKESNMKNFPTKKDVEKRKKDLNESLGKPKDTMQVIRMINKIKKNKVKK